MYLLHAGYQRELTFRHDDGSYSAFGKSDNSGSMWLTAFVVKSFAQARQFVFIDPSQLTTSMRWFRSKQLENGCFPQVGGELRASLVARGGSSTTVPLADKPIEMWICYFIPRHVQMYAESFVLRPTCRLGRRVSGNHTRLHPIFKERFQDYPSNQR